jgi:RAB protein geranylgeranyltransferase component A
MLREADMDKYMDFRVIKKLLFLVNDSFEEVPLSKGKIFESKVLGLL